MLSDGAPSEERSYVFLFFGLYGLFNILEALTWHVYDAIMPLVSKGGVLGIGHRGYLQ